MKKMAIILVVSLLALSVLMFAGYQWGSVQGQTESEPDSSAPAAEATAETTTVKNRPLARWVTTNQIMLDNLIYDSNMLETYLADEKLEYAEEAAVHLYTDINTMRNVPPPSTSGFQSGSTQSQNGWPCPPGPYVYEPVDYGGGLRYRVPHLMAAPSGYQCPTIPDAQAAADLSAGLATLEAALNQLIMGIETMNGELIRGAEPLVKSANELFQKVLEDIQKAQE